MLYRTLLRPLLFLLPPEVAHYWGMATMRLLSGAPALLRLFQRPRDASLGQTLWGRRFETPIGLAAGLDKDAEAYQALGALGFGHVEVGTLTAQAQPGNPQPRLFRLPLDRALINRMGFNNCGARAAAERIGRRPPRFARLGINIGKTKVVSADAAAEDYAISTRLLAPFADYLVVNVSSPNTPGLRDLQAVQQLRPLLLRVQREMAAVREPPPPLLVKIAPDLSDQEIDEVADLCLSLGIAGIIATNTTVARDGLRTPAEQVTRCGAGGLSGPVLRDRALAVLRRLRTRLGSRLTLVSVGGVETADDVWLRLAAGASLVQVYTGFIYGGPGLPARLGRDLARRLRAAGLSSVTELIGRDVDGPRPAAASPQP